MEIFIATSIKSFDLNPTHPGPRPRVSFHTSATNKSNAARAKRDRRSRSSERDKLAGGKQDVARAKSSCEFLCARGQ